MTKNVRVAEVDSIKMLKYGCNLFMEWLFDLLNMCVKTEIMPHHCNNGIIFSLYKGKDNQ